MISKLMVEKGHFYVQDRLNLLKLDLRSYDQHLSLFHSKEIKCGAVSKY